MRQPLELVRVSAGEFVMGTRTEDIAGLLQAYGGEQAWYEWEAPQHRLALPEYTIGETKKPPWVGGVAYPRFAGHQPIKEVFGYWMYGIRCGRYCQIKSKKDPRQIDTPRRAC